MSIYHIAIDARTSKPKEKYFRRDGIAYDVYSGRFDAVRKQLFGKDHIRPAVFASQDELITHFIKYAPNQNINIHVYDALFGCFYKLDAAGNRTDIDDNTSATLNATDSNAYVSFTYNSRQAISFDEIDITHLIAHSLFRPSLKHRLIDRDIEGRNQGKPTPFRL
jgi:hypothetical protein